MRFLGKTWISPENSIPQNILGVFLAVPTILAAMFVATSMIPFNRPSKLSTSEVKAYLEGFLEHKDGPFDWDTFISVQIEDEHLESIRQRATKVDLPLDEKGAVTIRQLLTEVESIRSKPSGS